MLLAGEQAAIQLETIPALKANLGLTNKLIPIYALNRRGETVKTYMLKITERGIVLV